MIMWMLMGVLPHSWPVQKWGASFESNWKKSKAPGERECQNGLQIFLCYEMLTEWNLVRNSCEFMYSHIRSCSLHNRSQINSDMCHQHGANYVANSFAVEFVSKAFHLISRSLPCSFSESSKILHPDLLVSCLKALVRTGRAPLRV